MSKYLIPNWPAPKNVIAITSTTAAGDMSCTEGLAALRQIITETSGTTLNLLALEQVHDNTIVVADNYCGGGAEPQADGCYTSNPGIGCCIKTADCLPVLICDRLGSAVMALHAGWQGLAKEIIPAGIATFKSAGVAVSDILVWIGPCICQEHYEVDEAFRRRFLDLNADYASAFLPGRTSEKWQADLTAIAKMQCAAAGVVNVYGGDICTYHDKLGFPSYRRDKNFVRMATVIGLKN